MDGADGRTAGVGGPTGADASRIAAVVDLRGAGEVCGDSFLGRVVRALARLGPGEVLEVVSGVREHTFTVTAWARKAGKRVLLVQEEGRTARILLENSRPEDGPKAG
jgi:TusA-related sulfurtransferase